jgi:Flp pilus assembly protein TadD
MGITPAEPNSEIHTLLTRAAEAFHAGRLSDAEKDYRTLVETTPDATDSWFLLGLVALKAGKTDEALGALERAVRLRPANALYRVALGDVYRAVRRLDEARSTLEYAQLLQPGSPKILLNLGHVMLAAGDREGVKLLRRAARRLVVVFGQTVALRGLLLAAPLLGLIRCICTRGLGMRAAIAFERGRLLASRHQIDRAMVQFTRVLDLSRNFVPALRRLALINVRREAYNAAAELLERAAACTPRSPAIAAMFAQVLSRVGRTTEALAVVESVPRGNRDRPDYLRALGWSLFHNNQASLALAPFEKACGGRHGRADSHFALASCLGALGRLDEAEVHLRTTLKADPKHVAALRSLADSKQLTVDDPLFATILALADDPRLPAERRSICWFAAGAVYRSAGDVDAAFQSYHRGNALKDVTYCPTVWSNYVDALRDAFDRSFFDRIQGYADPSELPIFIIGMPRSGTSLVEQILASHAQVHGGGERATIFYMADELGRGNERGFPACIDELDEASIKVMAERYLSELRTLSPEAKRITDKMPGNFVYLGLIAALLPRARIIYCRRDPMDTCLSIYFQTFAGFHPYAYDLENLGHYYREHERLMAHWREVLPSQMLSVEYEETVADQRGMTERLLDFCGLPWDERCLEYYKTASTMHTSSYAQVRQPIYTSAVKRWQKYEQHLGPLKEALERAA